MSWEAAAAIGELVGAAGMIVSILYLAQQIRANTNATKASASFQATHSWAQLNENLLSLPDELLAWAGKLASPAEDFSDAEWMRFTLGWRAVFQKLEGQYYLHRYGLLEDDLWQKRRAIARGVLDQPAGRRWWEGELRQAEYTDEFVAAIEASTPVDMTLLNRR